MTDAGRLLYLGRFLAASIPGYTTSDQVVAVRLRLRFCVLGPFYRSLHSPLQLCLYQQKFFPIFGTGRRRLGLESNEHTITQLLRLLTVSLNRIRARIL